MPVPLRLARWRPPVLLATVSMVVSVGLIAAFLHFIFKMSWGASILLGAIVAPTDPVLATEVQSRHPGDADQLRFTLTCEAGMNDGSAFPFVILGMGLLGLEEIGSYGVYWFVTDVIWATVGGVLIGWGTGYGVGRLLHLLHRKYRPRFLDDFLGFGLIGLAYGLSELSQAWGFLAVFFAAVALRQVEYQSTVRKTELTATHASGFGSEWHEDRPTGQVSSGALRFNEYLERFSELILILLVGGSLFQNSWSWRAVCFALFLFLVARPVSVCLGLWVSRTSWRLRGLASWFGVRGIGSIYYLMYVIDRGLPESLALEMIHITLIVITLSILIHGATVKPLMQRFWR